MAVESVPPVSYGKSLVVLNSFTGGLVTEPAPDQLESNEMRSALNVFVRQRGYLQLRTGQRNVVSSGQSLPIAGMIRFRTASAVYLVYGVNGGVFAYNEATTTTTTIHTAADDGGNYWFAILYDRLFWVNGRSGYSPQVWDGVAAASTDIGIVAPADNPSAGAVADPTLPSFLNDGSGGDPIQYYITYANARGVESNPGILGMPVYNTTGNATFQTDITGIVSSTDTQVTTTNLYRIGGGLVNALLVTKIATGTSFFNDNIPNAALSDTVLSFSHDRPPTGCTLIHASKTRLFLVNGNTVYVSTLGQPDYFPLVVTNPAIDGQVFGVEPDAENPIIALGGSGSSVLIARSRNSYLFQGDNVDNFTIQKICDVGCVAARSLVQCADVAFWLAPDGEVWKIDANGPECLTRTSISRSLQAIPALSRTYATAAYFDNQYHLCIPDFVAPTTTQTCRYFVYDLQSGAWTDLSEDYMAAQVLYADTGLSFAGELFFGTVGGYKDTTGSAFNGIVAALGPATTSGYNLYNAFDVWGGDLVFGRPDWLKTIYSINIRGKLSSKPSTTSTLTLYGRCESDSGINAVSISFNLTDTGGVDGTLLQTRIPTALIGTRLSWRLQGSASVFELESVELAPVFVRERRQ